MGLREWLNQNSALTTVAAVVILFCALGFSVFKITGKNPGIDKDAQAYYYDLVEGKIFGGKMLNTLSPIDGPNGTVEHKGEARRAGFRAYIFACGGCSESMFDKTKEQVEATGAKIGYLEFYNEKSHRTYKDEVLNPGSGDHHRVWDEIEKGKRIASVPSKPGTYPTLHKANGARGSRLQQSVMALCPDEQLPRNCMPAQ